MNPVLKKLLYKNQSPVLLFQAPAEFKETALDFEAPVHTTPKGTYGFALAFARSAAEAEKTAKTMKKALASAEAIFWMAYPKGTSKKYKSDINRDTSHALLAKYGFTGVSLVAIDDDWSAMRFKAKS